MGIDVAEHDHVDTDLDADTVVHRINRQMCQ